MRLVVSIVPARVEVHLRGRGIDAMWRRSFTLRPGQHVVCFVVFIVALGCVSGSRRRHRERAGSLPRPAFLDDARLAAERSPSLIIRAIEDRRHGCCVVNEFVNETGRNCRDGMERGAMAGTARLIVTCRFEPARRRETGTVLMTRRSQVRILSPLLKKVALTRPNGRQRELGAVSICGPGGRGRGVCPRAWRPRGRRGWFGRVRSGRSAAAVGRASTRSTGRVRRVRRSPCAR